MLFSADFPEGFRAAVELRGIRLGNSRQPLSDTQQIDRQQLSHVLQCILSDFGVVERPDAGCPPPTQHSSLTADRGQVGHVAQMVVEELRRRGVM